MLAAKTEMMYVQAKESANFLVLWPLRGGIFSMTCCAMVTRGLHTPMGSLRVHLHNHQIGISLSMLQPNKTLYQSYKCNRANDEWFLSSSASCCCCVLSPFFYRESKRERWHSQKSRIRKALTIVWRSGLWALMNLHTAWENALFWTGQWYCGTGPLNRILYDLTHVLSEQRGTILLRVYQKSGC
jgi:hypothetical protein